MKYAGALLVLVGSFALIPFKVDYLEMFDLPMYLLGVIGMLLLAACGPKNRMAPRLGRQCPVLLQVQHVQFLEAHSLSGIRPLSGQNHQSRRHQIVHHTPLRARAHVDVQHPWFGRNSHRTA